MIKIVSCDYDLLEYVQMLCPVRASLSDSGSQLVGWHGRDNLHGQHKIKRWVTLTWGLAAYREVLAPWNTGFSTVQPTTYP